MQTASARLACVLLAALQQPAGAPRGVADLFRPDAEACWTIEQGGRLLGECATRYEGEVGLGGLRAHLFRDQVRLRVPGVELEQRYTVELWTDERGHPLRFELRAQLGDVKSAAEGTFAGGTAELSVRQGPSEKRLSVKVPDGIYLLTNNFVSQLELALGFLSEGTSTFFSGSMLQTFPYSLKRVETPDGGLVYEDSLGERLHLSSERRLTLLEVPSQQLSMRRVEQPVERFTIELAPRVVPADIEREEVRIEDGGVSLAGTLTRKKGLAAKDGSGNLPAVFFLSGSGPQDREGFSSGIDVGTHEILDCLTREGFLVLRVDDRGVGGSTGPTEDLDFGDLVEDGRRAARFLFARPDVDAKRVVAIGHSEGGLSAPVLAAEEPLAAIVLLAAPGRPLEDLLREQLLLGKKQAGASVLELERFALEIDGFLDALAKGEELAPGGLPPELAAFVPARAWLESHIGRDPLAFLKKVPCPILILQGGKDVQVSAERDTPRIMAALAEAQHPDHELKLFPALDHLFKRASDPPSELDYLMDRPVDPEFLDALVAWLRERLMK